MVGGPDEPRAQRVCLGVSGSVAAVKTPELCVALLSHGPRLGLWRSQHIYTRRGRRESWHACCAAVSRIAAASRHAGLIIIGATVLAPQALAWTSC